MSATPAMGINAIFVLFLYIKEPREISSEAATAWREKNYET